MASALSQRHTVTPLIEATMPWRTALRTNLLVAKPGQRHAVGSRQFTRQRFDLHANLRGKKPGGAPAVADLEVPSAGAQKSVSAISKRSRGAHGDTRQYLCSPHPRLQRG